MTNIFYGYAIQDGKIVIDETMAEQVRQLFTNYLNGMALEKAADKAGIKASHGTVRRILENVHYTGDKNYPSIIDKKTYEQAKEEIRYRAEKLGRTNRKQKKKKILLPPVSFTIDAPEKALDDPAAQAEYLYSFIQVKEEK